MAPEADTVDDGDDEAARAARKEARRLKRERKAAAAAAAAAEEAEKEEAAATLPGKAKKALKRKQPASAEGDDAPPVAAATGKAARKVKDVAGATTPAQNFDAQPQRKAASAPGGAAARGGTGGAATSVANGDAGAGEGELHEVFVKFLPRDVTESEVEKLFSPCGKLARPPVLLRHYDTGAPKGAGWVTFTTAAAAKAALSRNGAPMRGRQFPVIGPACTTDDATLQPQQHKLLAEKYP